MLRAGAWAQRVLVLGLCLSTLCIANRPAWSQDYGARLRTIQRGGKVSFEPTGPGVLFDALDPVVQKWYVPQELYSEYNWRQASYSNYARVPYQGYVNTALEGNYFYDAYGNFLTRGWLIFDWRQQNPQPFGSTLFKDNRFGSWFNSLVIAADHKGQYHYAITVGDQIRTTLTPLTFSKPQFNGIQVDWTSDKYAATLILSRISEPNFRGSGQSALDPQRTNNTNLIGGRGQMQLGDFVKLGGTLVNAHHAQTQADAFNGNIIKGNLTGVQNLNNVTFVEVIIKDDSPEDGEAGGALFASDILIYDLEGQLTRGSEIGFRPLVEGGFQRLGFVAADGQEEIRLRYDFFDRSYTGPDPSEISRVRLELVLANDYRIEMLSDRQINFQNQIVPLTIARASGNVKDGSNQRVLAFDYGLPTANQVAGFTIELTDLTGLDGYFEFNINNQYRKFPNPNLEKHHISGNEARAWMGHLAKISHPYFAYGEFYSISPNYSTGFAIVDQNGFIEYSRDTQRYEFVDDNDDQDRFADWRRNGSTTGDREVFPGWDQNNDFISDFNQNDSDSSPNLIPDYDEPFLRLRTDRPDYLYGIDMNHNGTIDRFENDEEADYPYKRDRQGYNIYGGFQIGPQARITLGQLRTEQISDQRRARATYLLLSAERTTSRLRLRFFQDLRRVKDNIRDDLLQWVQAPNDRGQLLPTPDLLPAPNTWINNSWLGLDFSPWNGLRTSQTVKWQLYHQRDQALDRTLRGQRHQGAFLGLVSKAEYRLQIGRLNLIPAGKIEFFRLTPVQQAQARRRELSLIGALMSRLPILRASHIESGIEFHRFKQLRQPTPPGAEDNFTELTAVAQLSNISDYQGYRLTTLIGFDITRQAREAERTRTRTRGFLTVYAGVE